MKPISNTAFYCCGVRMQDAEHSHPVCRDDFAKYFMDERGLEIFSAFAGEKNPNAGNVARHRIIDDFIRQKLFENPTVLVILIGAGFDSRAYRLDGGVWLELDEPQIIAYKNQRLPIEHCKNPLQRLAIDFEHETLADKLQDFSSDQPIIVVIEGVFIYLPEAIIKQTLQTLQRLFPKHQLACDLMTDRFQQKYSYTLQQKFREFGAQFNFTPPKPEEMFCTANYQIIEKHSIIGKAVEFGTIRIPKFLFKTFFKTLATGYSIYILNHKVNT